MITGLLVGLVLGALLIGVPAVRGERLRRAGRDVRAAKTNLKIQREIWRGALNAFVASIGLIVGVALLLGALWLRATGRR